MIEKGVHMVRTKEQFGAIAWMTFASVATASTALMRRRLYPCFMAALNEARKSRALTTCELCVRGEKRTQVC